MILNGFGFSGYRNVDGGLAKIAPLRKINLIIGKNNSGKSNIIKFLSEHYDGFLASAKQRRAAKQGLEPIDYPKGRGGAPLRIAFPLNTDDERNEFADQILGQSGSNSARDLILQLLRSSIFMDSERVTWRTYAAHGPKGPFEPVYDVDALTAEFDRRKWEGLWRELTGQGGGDLTKHWIPQSIERILVPPNDSPSVEVIPAIRKVGEGGTDPDDYSGIGIIERLAKIQNPSVEDQAHRHDFQSINEFVREVLERDDAAIEIPYDRDMIIVHMDDKSLPLLSLGTGIHEVVILAAAATLLKNTILCVEEPELHLHPRLQRKLIQYMYDNTDNQYIFTTHSAHLLDAAPAEIFHVTNSQGSALVTAIASTKSRSEVCVDLGYRASDLLQANCIIWVEGPSDRIYINWWLRSKDPEITEGVHYSIMFYGGRLASHLRGNDTPNGDSDIDDFVSLRNLNRNAVFIVDSDKTKAQARINHTKKRLCGEFDEGPGFSWVTKGREIENYLDEGLLREAIKKVHPSASVIPEIGNWGDLLKYKKRQNGAFRSANKVKVARYLVEHHSPDFEKLDLRQRIESLYRFIVEANS